MHIFFYLISIALFSSISGETEKVFSDGKFKELKVGVSVPGTCREPFDLFKLVRYDNRGHIIYYTMGNLSVTLHSK